MNSSTNSNPGYGALVISLDFELHWGVRDKCAPDGSYRENLLGARKAVPAMLDLFEEFDIAATWATVGFLFAESRQEREAFSPNARPQVHRFASWMRTPSRPAIPKPTIRCTMPGA